MTVVIFQKPFNRYWSRNAQQTVATSFKHVHQGRGSIVSSLFYCVALIQ